MVITVSLVVIRGKSSNLSIIGSVQRKVLTSNGEMEIMTLHKGKKRINIKFIFRNCRFT